MTDNRPTAGKAIELEPGLTCVLAPNPSPMTYWGTNTYLLGTDSLIVIDPGPFDQSHLGALRAAIADRPVSHILVTHSHLDHSPLAKPLAEATGAQILAFGDSSAGRSDIMNSLAATGQMAGGEGVDHDFQPDHIMADGDTVQGDGWSLTAHHTPGHFGNHLCFISGDVGFTGDHLMGWASSLVSPPDGDLTDFMASCTTLAQTGIKRAYCGHGAPIPDAQFRLAELIAHRKTREAEIIAALRPAPADPETLTRKIYSDVAPALFPMAQRNVLAHLIDLTTRNIATLLDGENPQLSATTLFALK
ncbi:MBL fold metallo-hydrolase [Octadecabacter sp. 1_MG-2023]|uniref:MBL fold metallo-hydrolase n=1 Tax=unclassified Octadecabacter TaxID=196158 RepID=UPI001C083E1B|nr:MULTISPECIES: MBL fold metallo-hydrolase [unclassified Octadecabacter]MBU2993570.1 MBL fold metallo-hydrolase [Octadecabacter sp. B2R22]MDO6735586.1 MBL fold metallo-hydrolase [Octadecabacter sp. 1_MG-2023]